MREVELLVEAGFTPLEASKTASLNGAKFLGEDARIGSIAVVEKDRGSGVQFAIHPFRVSVAKLQTARLTLGLRSTK